MFQASQSIQSWCDESILYIHNIYKCVYINYIYIGSFPVVGTSFTPAKRDKNKAHNFITIEGKIPTQQIRFCDLEEFAALTQALYRLVHSSSTDASCSFGQEVSGCGVSFWKDMPWIYIYIIIYIVYRLYVYIYILYIYICVSYIYGCWRNMFMFWEHFSVLESIWSWWFIAPEFTVVIHPSKQIFEAGSYYLYVKVKGISVVNFSEKHQGICKAEFFCWELFIVAGGRWTDCLTPKVEVGSTQVAWCSSTWRASKPYN